MKRLSIALGATLLGAGLLAGTAMSQEGKGGPMPGMPGMQMPGMQAGPGMMGMMQGCPMMRGAAAPAAASALIPQLPPGNEKLQVQMNAEILQRVGEIASKYAAQVK